MHENENPDPASVARAARMREQIKDIEGGPPANPPAAKEEAPPRRAPRDFIRQRMRELDRNT